MKPVLIVFAICIGMAVLLVMAGGERVRTPREPRQPNLNITAGRGPSGLSLTNREPGVIGECTAVLLDAGEAEWTAHEIDEIAPSQTITFPRASFRQNGQPVPLYVWQDRDNFIVRCMVDIGDGQWVIRSAGIAF